MHAGRDAADDSDQISGTGEDETGNDNGTGEDDFSEGGDMGELLQRANGELGAAVPATTRRTGQDCCAKFKYNYEPILQKVYLFYFSLTLLNISHIFTVRMFKEKGQQVPRSTVK